MRFRGGGFLSSRTNRISNRLGKYFERQEKVTEYSQRGSNRLILKIPNESKNSPPKMQCLPIDLKHPLQYVVQVI